MSKFIVFAIVLIGAASKSQAQAPAVTPQSGIDRLALTCSQGQNPAGAVPYRLVGMIDWSAGALDGKAEFQLLRLNFIEGSRATGEQWMRIARFQVPVEVSEDAITQVIRHKNPTATDDLLITWRSAFPQYSPVDHYLIINGRSYRFLSCQATPSGRNFP